MKLHYCRRATLFKKSRSGNREVVEDEPPKASPAVQTERKETPISFQKPALLPANMRTTPVKATIEKHTQPTEKESVTEEVLPKTPEENEEKSTETANNLVEFSKECWDECVRNSCGMSKMAEVALLKLTPSPTDDYKIEFEVASEIQKNEIKQIQALLLQNLYAKTGNSYDLEMQITKIVREKTVDRSNPDEKFIHLCKENPHLLEFKQRLKLAVS